MDSQRRLGDAGPIACCKIWFEADGEYVFGAGIARLLENIEGWIRRRPGPGTLT
ncbi:MAG: hypothetical protein IH892_03830 [Planctomycetes bacterium]|nr:hypothetical protein [Planctomycetota bacterium]MCH8215884.1 hypothetical protein [Planctomycetota bacterium]